MSFFSRLFTRSIPTEMTVSPIYPFGSRLGHVGLSVNADSAMRCGAVFACVKVIAESVASLPLHLYQRLSEGGKSRAANHPLYTLLHDAPNPEQTSYEWRESTLSHLLLYGNAYSEIERNGAGRPIALWLLNPANMNVSRQDGQLVYTYRQSGMTYTLAPSQVLHTKALSTNGLTGLSPIAQAAEAIGLGLATEEFEARFFSNGGATGKILEIPARITPEKKTSIIESFKAAYSGLSKAHRLAVLDEGMKLTDSGVPPKDAQFLELRQFQLGEIARIFRVPPHMIGDLSRSTNNNIEVQSLEFVTYTLRPWLVRIEQAINRALLTGTERSQYFVEFLIDGLLRGDSKTRAEALQIQRQNGIICADEWREIENRNPLPNGQGQTYITPLNMAPITEPAPSTKQSAQRSFILPEIRELRAKNRRMVQQSFIPVIADAVGRIVRREVIDVGKLVKKHLAQRDASTLQVALEEFYTGDHRAFVTKNIAPSITALTDAIRAELDDDLDVSMLDNPDYQKFVQDYISTYATRYTDSSLGQLRSVIDDATANTQPVDEAIDQRLSEWKESRPDKEAKNESTRASNAVARTIFALAGITKLVWRNAGGDSCPVCRDLNGRVVGIDAPFAKAGDQIGEFSVNTNTKHPPIHRGCSCIIDRA